MLCELPGGQREEKMRKIFLIFIWCLCFIGCKKNQFQNNTTESVSSEISKILEKNNDNTLAKSEIIEETKTKSVERIVTNFNNSLTKEENINAYKELVAFLWDKKHFIDNNYDFIDGIHKSYKLNDTHALNTVFVNNELLNETFVKIGMSKDDICNILGQPNRSIVENNSEYFNYSYEMYVMNHYEENENIYACTSIDFLFDENKMISKIILTVEQIENPVDDSYWLWNE